jgi:predicted house-cleaning noncanonical NTP pyrophosphatase (MazG superfamily)
MTVALKKAFARASDLPAPLQEQLAQELNEYVEGEMKWDETLARSQDVLERLAEKARNAKKRGKTVRKGFDEL